MEGQPVRAPTVEVSQDNLNLEPAPEDDLDDLVLEPALDHRGRHLELAAEGVGEPDPLVLTRSPATMMPATQLLIPGPRERAQAQDQDAVLSVVKDWVQKGTVPRRLELDFGDDRLKAYVKIIPVLRLCQMPDQADLDILVKTDIQGRTHSERYCMPEKLINPFIKDLHLRLSHYGVETIVLTMKHLVWFPSMWSRVRQVLQVCPGCVQKNHKQMDKRVVGCYYPREKGNVASYIHLDLAGPLPRTKDGFKYILGIQCNFSCYCVTVPIKNKEHETVMKGFLDNWLFRFGPPVALISDNEWTSQAFKILCQLFQVEQRLPEYCITRKTKNDQTNQTTDFITTDKDPYQLLQKATYHEFEAHQCIQTQSRFFYSCVWASHSVMNVVPQTGRHVVTSIDFCAQAVRTNAYVTVSGASVALKSDGHPTYIVETIVGDLNVTGNGHVSCNGEDVRHHGRTQNKQLFYKKLISP